MGGSQVVERQKKTLEEERRVRDKGARQFLVFLRALERNDRKVSEVLIAGLAS